MCANVVVVETYPPRIFAKMVGRSVSTLQRWDRDGTLPARRTSTNRRYYTHEDYLRVLRRTPAERRSVTYARVSSPGQKVDLANQHTALEQFCIGAGKAISEHLEDVGSGLNYKRRTFLRLGDFSDR